MSGPSSLAVYRGVNAHEDRVNKREGIAPNRALGGGVGGRERRREGRILALGHMEREAAEAAPGTKERGCASLEITMAATPSPSPIGHRLLPRHVQRWRRGARGRRGR